MDQQNFESSLKSDGYSEIQIKLLEPRPANDLHDHPFTVRGLVLTGTFTVVLSDSTQTYLAGDVFTVEAGCKHSEAIGPGGAKILIGRKY